MQLYLSYMLVTVMNIVTCLCVLLSVAYYTLLERKILSYIQIRKGPNKVGLYGIFQPLADALKLLIKEQIWPNNSNSFLFCLVPMWGFMLSLMIWFLLPSFYSLKFIIFGLLLFVCISSLNVYVTMLAGWVSNSKYSFLGGIRAAAQTISYEVMMILILIFPALVINTLCWNYAMVSFPVFLLSFPLFMVWFVSTLAETNRAPFDFAEGESELVSGFNIEYQGGLFTLLFLGEYMSIMFMSLASVVWFMWSGVHVVFITMVLIMSSMFLFCRAMYPRYRYDLLMMLCWKSYLPFSLSILMMGTIMLIM